jgi:RNA polymerase sigma-70 factor (ECF subfamily)
MMELSLPSEKDLLVQVANGDEESFRQLFLKHHQQLGSHIFRLTNSMDLAEEIVQDVFLKIWLSREALWEVHNFKAYLFVVSKNHTLNCLRKLSKERISIKQSEENFARDYNYSEAELDIYYNLLDEAINQLPAQQQKVYLLSRHERLRYAEVAVRLNISRETVKKYLQIATVSITEYVQAKYNTAVFLAFVSLFF